MHFFFFLVLMLIRVYGNFSMEVILATAFGRIINLQKGESDSLTEAASHFFASEDDTNNLGHEHILTILSESYSSGSGLHDVI